MMLPDLNFQGKRVWVTGAHQGIGLAIAAGFVQRGAVVTGFDRQFHGESTENGMRLVQMDLASESSCGQALSRVLDADPVLDILVNAAGIIHMGTVETLSAALWQDMFDVNVSGLFRILNRTVPVFKAQRKGAIVNVGSNAAHVPRTHMAGYAATKAALTSLSQCVALDLAPYGVRCNLVSPGSTDTPMQRGLWSSADDSAKVIAGAPDQFRLGIPLGKIASPGDIANVVMFLASDLAGHITMQDIVVDGGATLGA